MRGQLQHLSTGLSSMFDSGSARWADELTSLFQKSSDGQSNTAFTGQGNPNTNAVIDRNTLSSYLALQTLAPFKPPGLEDSRR